MANRGRGLAGPGLINHLLVYATQSTRFSTRRPKQGELCENQGRRNVMAVRLYTGTHNALVLHCQDDGIHALYYNSHQ